MITSFDATVSASGGGSRSQTFTGLSLGYLAAIDLQFDSSLAALAGLNNYTLTISNINGTGADDDVSNNTGTATATAYTLNPTKKFVVEEGRIRYSLDFFEILGQSIKHSSDLNSVLLAATPGSIVFVDEALLQKQIRPQNQ